MIANSFAIGLDDQYYKAGDGEGCSPVFCWSGFGLPADFEQLKSIPPGWRLQPMGCFACDRRGWFSS
jgi:hypothetical protein